MFMIIYATVMTCVAIFGALGWFAAILYSKENDDLKENIAELRCACKYMQGKEDAKKVETKKAETEK